MENKTNSAEKILNLAISEIDRLETKNEQLADRVAELVGRCSELENQLTDAKANCEHELELCRIIRGGNIKPRPIATPKIVLPKHENVAMQKRFNRVSADATAGCYNSPWPTFDAFVYDVGPSPESGAVFEKINPNKPYSNDNCRWRFRGQKQRGLIMETKNKTVWQKRNGGK